MLNNCDVQVNIAGFNVHGWLNSALAGQWTRNELSICSEFYYDSWERRRERESETEKEGTKRTCQKTERKHLQRSHADKHRITFAAFLMPRPLISSVASLLCSGISWYAAVALRATWTPFKREWKRDRERAKEKMRRGNGDPRGAWSWKMHMLLNWFEKAQQFVRCWNPSSDQQLSLISSTLPR